MLSPESLSMDFSAQPSKSKEVSDKTMPLAVFSLTSALSLSPISLNLQPQLFFSISSNLYSLHLSNLLMTLTSLLKILPLLNLF